VSAPPSPSSRYIMILMLCDRQYLISSLRTFEKIKPAVNLQTTRVIPVGLLASVIGQPIPTQAVLGKSVGLRTRYAYDCVLDRLYWDSPIWITHEAEGKLRFWLENIEKMNFEGSYFSQLTISVSSP
jgi:hypothetical protein